MQALLSRVYAHSSPLTSKQTTRAEHQLGKTQSDTLSVNQCLPFPLIILIF